MPTTRTIIEKLLCHIGAAVYLFVLFGLIVFIVHETIMQIKWKMEEKKDVQDHKSKETSKTN